MALRLFGFKISRDWALASLFFVSLLLIVVITYYVTKSHPTASSSSSGCEIDPLQAEAPLLLISGTSNFSYPSHGERVIKSESEGAIDFACPGGSVVVNGNKLGSVVTATCVSDQEFEIQNGRHNWSQVSCSGQVEASTKKSGRSCGEGGEEILIGFDLGDGRFATLISACFDTKQETPIYSQFTVTSSIQAGALTSSTNRPYFYQDKEFYNTVRNLDKLYIRKTQKKTINTLLSLPATSTQYIKDDPDDKRYFLSRGHLAARADFFYVAQQNATFRFLNAAPQWQALNGYNWEKAERDTRNYADKNKVDLQIWTGIFNTSTLPDINKKQTSLYLYSTNNEKLIPVPAFFWKVVYNPKNEKGIALVSFNNPYKSETEIKEEIFCDDVADQVKWLTWDKTNLDGYSFACSLTEFQKVVNVAPKLKDSGLLL